MARSKPSERCGWLPAVSGPRMSMPPKQPERWRWHLKVALASAIAGASFSEPVAAVTFDDGYRDVHEHALPVLKRKGIPAAMFVVTNLVGQPSWQIHDKLYHLMDKAFATWSDPQKRLFDVLTALQIPAAIIFRNRSAFNSSMSATATMLPALSQMEVARVMTAIEASV